MSVFFGQKEIFFTAWKLSPFSTCTRLRPGWGLQYPWVDECLSLEISSIQFSCLCSQYFIIPPPFQRENQTKVLIKRQLVIIMMIMLLIIPARYIYNDNNSSCPFDRVTIYDGPDKLAEKIGTYCGQMRNLVVFRFLLAPQ